MRGWKGNIGMDMKELKPNCVDSGYILAVDICEHRARTSGIHIAKYF